MSSRGSRILAAIAGLAFLLAPTAPAAGAQALHLTGRGGDSDWVETPVVVQVKAPIAAGAYVLEDGLGVPRSRRPCSWMGIDDGSAAVLPKVAAGKPFSYAVKPQPRPARPIRAGSASALTAPTWT